MPAWGGRLRPAARPIAEPKKGLTLLSGWVHPRREPWSAWRPTQKESGDERQASFGILGGRHRGGRRLGGAADDRPRGGTGLPRVDRNPDARQPPRAVPGDV